MLKTGPSSGDVNTYPVHKFAGGEVPLPRFPVHTANASRTLSFDHQYLLTLPSTTCTHHLVGASPFLLAKTVAVASSQVPLWLPFPHNPCWAQPTGVLTHRLHVVHPFPKPWRGLVTSSDTELGGHHEPQCPAMQLALTCFWPSLPPSLLRPGSLFSAPANPAAACCSCSSCISLPPSLSGWLIQAAAVRASVKKV